MKRTRYAGAPGGPRGRAGRGGDSSNVLGAIARQLAAALDTWVAPLPAGPVGGGTFNDGFRWESGAGSLFVKVARVQAAPMFEAEAAGLSELALANAVRVPRVMAVGEVGGQAYLALEWLDLRPLSAIAQQRLGERLAALHRHQPDGRHGWWRDNTIGSTPQRNTWAADWASFFIEHRLSFQLELALRNGHGARLQSRMEALLRRAGELLQGHAPPPSLLHGDLWGGNAAAISGDEPVIFDPAVYYGDREIDIAMTRLFGGFGPEFHAAYEAAWPLPPGAARRVGLYNLYHVLNHVNLFGASYLGQATSLIDSVLAAD